MSWIKDIVSPKTRHWEEFYRNRFHHDKIVRSTHGVNCTGGCSWNIHVKDGIVVWETQALDYPALESSLPPYEPRGCQRGISFSWYLYSPVRVKYPLIRGALMDLFRDLKKEKGNAYDAWKALQEDPAKRERYQKARGKGGFRRLNWDDALEIIAAANMYTVKKYGPDRITGFSPIPAMSMISYAAGSRFLQLMGGVNLSFYDWYCDLPNSFPEIWGEQTDVAESADWYNAKFVAVMGANLGMTRTPDVHFFSESRHNGTKTVVFSPDFSMVSKYADTWIPIHAGQDGAFWMAVTHVLLQEFHHEKRVPYFIEYTKRYTDSPYLVELKELDGKYVPDKLVRANRVEKYVNIENGDWKFLNFDELNHQVVCPSGSAGHRWGSKDRKWNMKFRDGETDEKYDPVLSLLKDHDEIVQAEFTEFASSKTWLRGVPVRSLKTKDGRIKVTTVYDLIMAQYGVSRGLEGEYPKSFDDPKYSYTPAWQEIYSGTGKETVKQFAREWGKTAELTKGKCMIIIGAGINHWYHNNLIYRAGTMALMLTGSIGVQGGGMNHYVGQEKLAPVDSWGMMMAGKDWQGAARLQQTPIWHYMHSDQWRYDGNQSDYNTVPENDLSAQHTADLIVKSVKNGWMPFFPQYNKHNFEIIKEAEEKGAKSEEDIKQYIVDAVKSGDLKYTVEDPDDEMSFPRVWFIWRGNALMSSAKGHEFFLRHYLGTHDNAIAEESAKGKVNDVKWHEKAPRGKMDLIVDLNFRMDTSALYSDIVLPAASWYEKDDLNSTDMHSFIHPLSKAIAPVWESKSDWAIFREIAKKTSELAAEVLPGKFKDLVNTPIAHDSPGEIAQSGINDWSKGECEAIPGKTMHDIKFVERDYTQIHQKFISLGENVKNGLGAHGNSYESADVYEDMLQDAKHLSRLENKNYPSLKEDEEMCNAILKLSSLTNAGLSKRAYVNAEKKTGLSLQELGGDNHIHSVNFKDLQAQPRRYNNSPIWSGLMHKGRAYSAYTYNVERLVPWRTLTGRQHFYLDHEGYIKFGEHLPTYKPSPTPEVYGELKNSVVEGTAKVLNVLTPHGKWHIHSTYGDTLRMLTLSRGMEPCWLSEEDAEEMGIKDNDWVEVFNDNGVYCTRACVSARIPKGVSIVYHSPERTYSAPKSETRGRRGGGHNSFTRLHFKPNLLMGGYGQFSYHFNYWGPVGVNRDTHCVIRKMDKVKF
ncbi:MAG: nitrate reductase subunit alpha [Bacteroidales bacterium]|nr:nitrate reductase subunit alpha [Bacteroidales bacterium]MCF8343949.1 nitrate reductase subunit alpha [Bacteroidales bacterium]MCF8351199.1 nitrate reductase subunit alpha [Bacteroidales bacterium]MCF8375328.1 nitrate reductase subunit alpha [Bacteroidales bacterium]MCF8400184.1 nitrate reductase subunit alpha [Bacteroidales bacterium]